MADTSKAIQALKETRPPATEKFTYLTLIEQYMSPEVLPTLNEILQDADLTKDIGWDLVKMLVPLSGSEECLETIARLGNPREVILTVLEELEQLHDDAEDDEAVPASVKTFITLLGMLAILHRRIKTKYPSRFLATTLRIVLATYRPKPEMTASVINLVHSLSGRRRPPLPTRKSSVNVANPDHDGDASKNAPDPEAEQEDPTEGAIQQKLLLSFVSCVIEAFVNVNSMEWSPRLLEYYNPEKLVPGKKTTLQKFKEDGRLVAMNTILGQLVALTRDLGLSQCTKTFIDGLCRGPIHKEPLAELDDISSPDEVALSTGGSICIIAYWIFSSTVFKADQPKPEMHVFPHHLAMMKEFMADDAQFQIVTTPGTVEAILAIGLWLDHNNLITTSDNEANFMSYHHLLTLCGVFHPTLEVRSAAISLAGQTLHADPDEDGRLKILEDLLENCMFASLKACAVTWLREEIISARTNQLNNAFSSPDALEQLQYLLFPDLQPLKEMDKEAFVEYWIQNSAFIIQAANFIYFLFCSETYNSMVPAGMGPAVEQRYVEPLLHAASSFEAALKDGGDEEGMGHIALDLGILADRLKSLSFS